ncbi:MAG: LytR C-terminal domain-containing protein [Ilumatobacteraceae bacterium]
MIQRTTRRDVIIARAVVVTVAISLVAASCSSDSGAADTNAATTLGVPVDPTAPVDPNATTTVAAVTTSSSGDSVGESPTTAVVVESTTTTIPPTTTTTIALVTEGALVLVANAAGVPGAASQLSNALQSVGFAMKEPTDAAGYEESLDASKIYFRPEAEAAAQSIAAVLQINSITRMPTPAPIVDAMVGLGDATILIMLGKDLAGKDLPGLAGR